MIPEALAQIVVDKMVELGKQDPSKDFAYFMAFIDKIKRRHRMAKHVIKTMGWKLEESPKRGKRLALFLSNGTPEMNLCFIGDKRQIGRQIKNFAKVMNTMPENVHVSC